MAGAAGARSPPLPSPSPGRPALLIRSVPGSPNWKAARTDLTSWSAAVTRTTTRWAPGESWAASTRNEITPRVSGASRVREAALLPSRYSSTATIWLPGVPW